MKCAHSREENLASALKKVEGAYSLLFASDRNSQGKAESAMIAVRDRDSVADDAGEPSRFAKQLITRVVNLFSGNQVVSAETAIFALLGHVSFKCSEKFSFAAIWPLSTRAVPSDDQLLP